MMPNEKACYFGTGSNTDQTMIGAGSFHSGGVNVMMCDGHIQFVKNSVNRKVWRDISTKDGGEVVSADAL